jgi:hypothetical protein
VDPTRIHYDPESGVQALASCSNVVIDDTGRISRRQGFSLLQAGHFHSLHCNQGDCLVIQEHAGSSALYRVNSDFSLTGIRSGLSKGRPMAFHSVNGQIYYSNGVQTGVYSEASGSSAPWVKGETIGHRTDRETYDPPPATHIASIGINMILADAIAPVLWTSEPGTFNAFNLDDGHHNMTDPVTLVKAVADGAWIGTARSTMFLSGTVPSEWQVTRRLPYGVKDYSASHEMIAGSRLSAEGIQGDGWFWLSHRGPCWGGPGGQLLEFGQRDIDWRDFAGHTGACLVTEDKVIFTIEP